MAKIFVNKKVFWIAAGRQMEGKVKQILSDHAIVSTEDSNYIVHTGALSTQPIQKTAGSNKTVIVAAREPNIPTAVRTKATAFLWKLTANKYYEAIPIHEMSEGLKQFGIDLEQDFILTGRDGRDTFNLTYQGQSVQSMLALQWHKMDSGRWEVNAYLT
jgi:hypothetical protein